MTPSPTWDPPKGIAQQVFEYIAEQLLTGAIAPGERLSDRQIADQLGVSRTPVREALIRLERYHVVRTEPRRGTFVRALDAGDIKEIYDVRLLLEGLAAECAAQRITAAGLELLVQACRDFAEGIDRQSIEACARADYTFHRVIVRESEHSRVVSVLQDFDLPLFAIGSRTPDYFGRAPRYLAEHLAVVEALGERDGAAARRILQDHIGGGRDELVQALAAGHRVG
jgi:DNA-binding GntR family transcriptional regulator